MLASVSLGDVKSFLEKLRADGRFRDEVVADPERIEAVPGLSAARLRPLWDPQAQADHTEPAVVAYRAYQQERLERSQALEALADPVDPRFRQWRDRQVARTRLQLGMERATRLRHLPAALELSQGCSVGCWFCGVSAPKLSGHFLYEGDNVRLWHQVLDSLRAFVGPQAVRRSFCYWATDPLDNPDYERFCLDFHERLGAFPSLTTALALRDVERTRRLLTLARERGGQGLHFSMLSLSQFHKIQAEFTPEELLPVDLFAQFAGSGFRLARTGRARTGKQVDWMEPAPNTIACLSGFLINMVERSLQLVTTCPADDRWPNGYWVLEKSRFDDLGAELERLAARHMYTSVEQLPRLAFLRGLEWECREDGFRAFTPHAWVDFSRPGLGGALQELARLLAEGAHSAGEIELLLNFQHGIPARLTRATLETAFERGILSEEPCE